VPTSAQLIFALLVTWLIEWSVVSLFNRRVEAAVGFGLLLMNAVTNPLANAAFHLANLPFPVTEAGVVALEIFFLRCYFDYRWRTACLLGVAANLTSAFAGLIWAALPAI
jgi:hypothetical protein